MDDGAVTASFTRGVGEAGWGLLGRAAADGSGDAGFFSGLF